MIDISAIRRPGHRYRPQHDRTRPIYDLASNAGWVSVGVDHDTTEFAVQTIRSWWRNVGCKRYPDARHLTSP